MSLKDLTKEQKQYIVLGVLAFVILIVLLVFGIRFSLSSIGDAKKELGELTDKIQNADRTLGQRNKVSSDFQKSMQMIKQYLDNAPPDRNQYSWATEVVYSAARKVGLEIDTIDEISGPATKTPKKGDIIRFESYALRISSHGSYESVKRFIESIKADYPLVRFSGVDINVSKSPELHNVQMWMQWPLNLGFIAEQWKSVEAKQRELGKEGGGDALADEPAASLQPVANQQPVPVKAAPKIVTTPPVAPAPELAKPSAKPIVKREPVPPAPRVESKAATQPIASAPSVEAAPKLTAGPGPRTVPPEEIRAVPAATVESTVVVEKPEPIVEAPVAAAKPEPMVEAKIADIPPTSTSEPKVDANPEAAAASTEPTTDAEQPNLAAVESTFAESNGVVTAHGNTAVDASAPAPQPETEVGESVTESSVPAPEETIPEATEDGTSSKYVATEKSARLLEQLLQEQSTTKTNETLSSLLDSLMEAAYDNP